MQIGIDAASYFKILTTNWVHLVNIGLVGGGHGAISAHVMATVGAHFSMVMMPLQIPLALWSYVIVPSARLTDLELKRLKFTTQVLSKFGCVGKTLAAARLAPLAGPLAECPPVAQKHLREIIVQSKQARPEQNPRPPLCGAYS